MGEVLHGATRAGHSDFIVQFVEPLWQPLPLPFLASPAFVATATTKSAQIGVWFADLRELAPALDALPTCLSLQEMTRCERVADPLLRRRQRHSRTLLRVLLSALTQQTPESLEFVSGTHGKPALREAGLHFNLSHSQNLWLLAASRGLNVGVDIEAPRRVHQWQRLAQRVFSVAELAMLDVSAACVPEEFFVGWTRKEAVLKGLGAGLSFGATAVEAGLTTAQRTVYFAVAQPTSWQVSSLPAPVPSHAALAWTGEATTLSTHHLLP